jgi:hypothetical protein
LNTGTSSERIYLCFKRDFLGNPIVDMQPVFPTKGEEWPEGFYVIEKSVTNVPANLNLGSNGIDIFLCYKQQLTRLWCLLNESSNTLAGSSSAEDLSLASRRGRRLSSPHETAAEQRRRRASCNSKSPLRSTDSSTTAKVRFNNSRAMSPVRSAGEAAAVDDQAGVRVDSFSAEYDLDPDDDATVEVSTNNPSNDDDQPPHSVDEEDDSSTNFNNNNNESSFPAEFYDECSQDKRGPDLVQLRKVQEVVDATGHAVPLYKRKLLYAMLSTIYIRQGVVAEMMIVGLTKLLKDTDFYEQDLQPTSSTSLLAGTLTMFDVTIEVVCDHFDQAIELEHERILLFLRTAIKHSGATMSPFTLQRMFRTLTHICNCYSTKSNWIQLGYSMPCNDPMKDITPFKVFKHLIWDMVAQTEKQECEIAQRLPGNGSIEYADDDHLHDDDDDEDEDVGNQDDKSNGSSSGRKRSAKKSKSYYEVRDVLEDLIEETMDSVEIAHLCETTFSVISKQINVQSHFWRLMNGIGKKLFVDHAWRSAFVILCAIVSQAMQPIRMTNKLSTSTASMASASLSTSSGLASASSGTTGRRRSASAAVNPVSLPNATNVKQEPLPRDIGSKLVALEAINEYCLSTGEKLRTSKIMGYQIRRIVIPCLLHNVSYAMNDHRIFAKILKIITALWKKWRRHIRIEFAILCEHLVFRVLQASVLQIRPIFQMIAIQEVTNWFDQPYMLMEMFVNYDMNSKFVSHWNTFSYLVRAMCSISRQVSITNVFLLPCWHLCCWNSNSNSCSLILFFVDYFAMVLMYVVVNFGS